MTCGHCTKAVTDEVSRIDGVTAVDIDLDTKQVTVNATADIAWDALVAAVDEAGFEAVAS
jgi:copper chaperone CopZ